MALFQKKEKKIYFPDRKPVKESEITISQQYTIDDCFGNAEKIMAIEIPRAVAERMKAEGKKKSPAVDVCPLDGLLCYRENDESRVYELLTETRQQIAAEKKVRTGPEPEPSMVERRTELDNLVGGANARAAGVPEQKSYLERMGLAEQPPTEEEKQLAEKAAVEELGELPPPLEEKKPKKRKSLGRTNQIMTRLTDAELKTFQSRVKKSGLAQGEYLRSIALTGQVVINERSEIDVAILDELAKIRAELGRQGGLLKMVIKPNEGQRELAPEEWAALIGAVREMEKARDLVSRLEVKVTNGNYQAPKQ